MEVTSDTSSVGGGAGFAEHWDDQAQTRVDNIHARLGTQTKRTPTGTTTDSDVLEASYAPFVKVEVQPATSWMRPRGRTAR